MLDLIAFRNPDSSELAAGIRFFAWARRMVVDAYYTSAIGIKDLGYMGNTAVAQFSVPQEAIDYALKRSPAMRIFVLLLAAAAAWAADDLTVYELLAPSTHSFDIIYDVTVNREGSPYFFNPIRPGSVASKERVIDLATGKPLEWGVVDGKSAKASGGVGARTANDAEYLRVTLLKPVPKGGVARIRIYKTYTDPPSYYDKDSGFVFDRPLGIKRNVVVLPKGYEVVGSASPGIVSTDADGRIRISFLNDRDDQLPVKITGRKLP